MHNRILGIIVFLLIKSNNFKFRLVQVSHNTALQKTSFQNTSEPLRGYRYKSLQTLLKE